MSASRSSSTARQLFNLAAPVIGLNVLSVLTLAVDTAMCGRLENSATALTALGFATQVVFLLLVGMMGLTVGAVALVSRAHGAGKADRVNHVLSQSTMLTGLLGLTAAVVGNILARPIVELMGASGEVTDTALRYLRPLLLGSVFYYLTILYGATLRGVGNTRLPFLVALVANVVNWFLNYCLILGNLGFPALGVRGAAIGTIMSQLLSVTIMVLILRRGVVPNLSMPLRPRPIDRALAVQLYRIGAPAALDMIILNAAFLSIIGMLGRIDQIAVAAHGIGMRVQALAFVPGLSVSQATGAMVGQALGAGDVERARRVVRASVVLCTLIMTTLALIIITAAHPILAIFDVTRETPLEAYAVEWMRLLGYGMPIVGVHIAMVGMLQGSGATKTSLRINVFATLALQIPLGALLGFVFDLGATGVWVSFPLSFIAKAALTTAAYRRGSWAKVGVTA